MPTRSPWNSFSTMPKRSRTCFSQHSIQKLQLDPKPRELRFGTRIRLLPLDVPVLQLFERDRLARHRAADIGAGTAHFEIPVEIFDFRLAGIIGAAFILVHCVLSPDEKPRREKSWQAGSIDFLRRALDVIVDTDIGETHVAVIIERVGGVRIFIARLSDRAE